MSKNNTKDYEFMSYASLTDDQRENDVLKAITAVRFVYRSDLPLGFNEESMKRLNRRFWQARLPRRLMFEGDKLVLKVPDKRKKSPEIPYVAPTVQRKKKYKRRR